MEVAPFVSAEEGVHTVHGLCSLQGELLVSAEGSIHTVFEPGNLNIGFGFGFWLFCRVDASDAPKRYPDIYFSEVWLSFVLAPALRAEAKSTLNSIIQS